MADLPASSGDRSLTTLTDLTNDALLHCAGFLHSHRDLSNLAMSCKLLKSVAYSDPIWQRLFRNEWPDKVPSVAQFSGLRDAYLARRTAVQQFKFVDPLAASFYTDVMPCNQILVDKSDVILSKGSLIQVLKIGTSSSGSFVTLHDHNARITCMRLFPLNETSLFRSSTQGNESVLVTSSCDRSIRLWWKGHCQRCFRGHTGPVLSLSDKLLGDATSKVFASGGEDNTVRLWSLSSSGKRGQRGLKATFYGHERPIEAMSVAGHLLTDLPSAREKLGMCYPCFIFGFLMDLLYPKKQKRRLKICLLSLPVPLWSRSLCRHKTNLLATISKDSKDANGRSAAA